MQKQQVCVHTTVCLLSGGFHLVKVKPRQLKRLLHVLPAASSSLFYSLLHTNFSSIFSYIPPSRPGKRMSDYLGPTQVIKGISPLRDAYEGTWYRGRNWGQTVPLVSISPWLPGAGHQFLSHIFFLFNSLHIRGGLRKLIMY